MAFVLLDVSQNLGLYHKIFQSVTLQEKMREETAIFSGLIASMSICTVNNYQQSYFLLGSHQSPVCSRTF